MSAVLVFAGPSLPAGTELDPSIRLMPPARCGDLIRALRHDPVAIGLVDGVFEVAPTVWHKEILAAMDRGVAVYGAASLGALRAAELDRYGMIGVGAIYEAYRDGIVESDAAVMVTHAPAELGYRPLTVALVDVEATLRAARLDPADLALLRLIASRMNFRDRSWTAILADFAARADVDRTNRVSAEIASCAFSQKERDTMALLDRITARHGFAEPGQGVPRTVFLERLLNICAM